MERDNFKSPLFPGLNFSDVPTEVLKQMPSVDMKSDEKDSRIPRPTIDQIPKCPLCKEGLLRPGVVWFGEALPQDVLDKVDTWLDYSDNIDLMLVIGTSAEVYPAAQYVDVARKHGARVAVLNMDKKVSRKMRLKKSDWLFENDAAEVLPTLFEPVIGAIEDSRASSSST